MNENILKDPCYLNIGPFNCQINTNIQSVALNFSKIYDEHPRVDKNSFIDFKVNIKAPNTLRRYIKPTVSFLLDEQEPFKPLPASQGFAMLEWGLNWCIANHAHHLLIFHAAVIEKDGICVILPAPPGSGKSTLCATLVLSGWRLLSDELTLVSLKNGEILPVVKPINLKNNSIDIIKEHFPTSVFSSIAHDTHKGNVALLKPPKYSIKCINKNAKATHIIFPKYSKNSTLACEDIPSDEALIDLIKNSFNYHLLGELGFNALINLVRNTKAMRLTYSQLDDGINFFNSLINEYNHNN
ncbi:HprK-related kinase A [Thalassotalea agariperforans]